MTAIVEQKTSLVTKFASKFGVDPDKMLVTLKATAFRQRDNKAITNEQMMGLLIVADQYGLNPWTKEIFAFEDKGAIIPVVSVDGWNRIVNEHGAYDGVEFRYAEKFITMPDGKPCPEWCEAVMYRTDRSRPIVVREYLDEVYQPPRGQNRTYGPWQTHTKRMLRWKALIQGARVAFGFAGIYDEDEATRIIEGSARVVEPVRSPGLAALEEKLVQQAEGGAEPNSEPSAPVTGQPEPPVSLEGIELAMSNATTRDELDAAYDLSRELPEDKRKQALSAYEARLAEIEAA